MARVSNTNCASYVANQKPFIGHNLSGKQENGLYIVYSYGWYRILVCKNNQWHATTDKYSVSTAKQLSQASRELSNIRHISQQEINAL